MVKRAGVAPTPTAFNSVVPQPANTDGDAQAATMDALGREAISLRNRLQPLANENAKNVAQENAMAGNYKPKMTLVQEDEAYNNAIEGAFQAKLATDVENTVSALVRDHPIGEPVEMLQGQIEAAKGVYLKQAPSEYAPSVGSAWDKVGGRASIAVADTQKKKAINDAATAWGDRLEVIENRLSNADNLEDADVKGLLSEWEAGAAILTNPLYGIDSGKLEIRHTALKDKILMRGVVKQAEGIYDEKGLDASRDFLESVRKDTSFTLPDSQRDAIYSEAWSNIRFKDSEIKREAAERKAEARASQAHYRSDLSGRMQDAMLAFQNGLSPGDNAPKPDEVRRIFGDTRANIYEAAMGGAPLMAELKTATAPELNAIMNEPKPDPTKPGFKQTLADWDRRQKAARKLLTMRDEDSMLAHIESGVIAGGDLNAALKDDASLGQFLRARAVSAIEASKEYGTKASPLTKQEAKITSDYLDRLPAGARAKFFESTAKSLGKENAAAYRALARQMRPGSVAFTGAAMLMSIEGKVNNSFDSKEAASILFRGDAILRQSGDEKEADGKLSIPMPDGADMRSAFNRKVGDAYKGNLAAEDQAYKVFRTAYAGLMEKTGAGKGSMDNATANDAVDIATGGLAKWRDQKIPLPWGMSDKVFRERINRGWYGEGDVQGFGEKFNSLKGTDPTDWNLMVAGDGAYFLVRGNVPALADDGATPIRVWVRK